MQTLWRMGSKQSKQNLYKRCIKQSRPKNININRISSNSNQFYNNNANGKHTIHSIIRNTNHKLHMGIPNPNLRTIPPNKTRKHNNRINRKKQSKHLRHNNLNHKHMVPNIMHQCIYVEPICIKKMFLLFFF